MKCFALALLLQIAAVRAVVAPGNEGSTCRKLPIGKPVIKVTLKPETEVGDVIAWMASITCRQFIVPGTIDVHGKKVTIVASDLITVEKAYRLFLDALDSVGLTVEPSGKFLRIIETSKPRVPDCFLEAASRPAMELHLVAPTSLEWNRRAQDEISVMVDVINRGKKTWLVNRRGFTGFSPLSGHQEFFLRITKANGQSWGREGVFEFEGIYPRRNDYVELRGGTSLKIPIRVSGAIFSLDSGIYSVELCFWDRWQDAGEGHPGVTVFRGPVLLPAFRLSVMD